MKDPNDDLGFSLPEPRRLTPTRALAIAACALVVLGVAFVIGWLPRHRARAALEAETKDAEVSVPRVVVIKPKPLASDRAIVLPGSIQPLEETVVYPRASGYVRKWSVDIGDKVAEGALLAEIDTPELDQQLAQARAQLAQAEAGMIQAQANAAYSKTNAARYERLAPAGVASQQELEKEKAQATVDEANVAVAKANVAAQHANIERLVQLKSFARVTAPFGGTITARMIDRGALVTAGNATPLFRLAATDPVRVFVQAPQDVATVVRVETPAHVTVREFAGRVFDGKIAHAAGALDPTTRTMMTEIRVPNPNGELLAGMYAQVSLTLPTPHRVYEVPATALMSDAKGVRVATVGPGGAIHLLPVAIERDTGATVELASGLDGTERIVKIADVELTEGRVVEAAP